MVILVGALAMASVGLEEAGQQATVAVKELEYHDIPGGRGFTAGVLRAGDEVEVLRVEPSGWAAIAPPPGRICWVDEERLEPVEDGGPYRRLVVVRRRRPTGG